MISKVYIKPEVRAKMEAYIRNCPFEISGLGMVEEEVDKFGNERLIVSEIFLLEQEGSAASTTLDPASLAKFVTKLAMEGVDTSKLKWWWHSHVNFACFWSQTDDKCMDAFKAGGYFIGTVGNKSGDSKTRIDVYGDIRMSLDNVDLITLPDQALEEEVKKEIAEKVTEVHIISPKGGGRGRNTGKYTRRTTRGKHSGSGMEMVKDSIKSIWDYGDGDDSVIDLDVYTEDEFRGMANGMNMTFDELLEQECMTHSNGHVF